MNLLQNNIMKTGMNSSVLFALVCRIQYSHVYIAWKYKTSISYHPPYFLFTLVFETEFLQDPASCGQCQSRFCLNCIRRVARMAGANTLAKCPTCRCEFSTSDIRRDSELRERMQRANTVECQYQGCSAQLSLNQVKSHEQSCLFVPLKCRYATFGCDWKGTRQLLTEHESICPLMQVSDLVEQFRQTRADHEHSLNLLQTRVSLLFMMLLLVSCRVCRFLTCSAPSCLRLLLRMP